MTAKILDGRTLAAEIQSEIGAGVLEMQQKHGVTPGLAALLVGDDPASAVYVRNKRRACEEAGIFSETFGMPSDSSPAAVLDRVQSLNADPRFHGILVQLPLPVHIQAHQIIDAMDPEKDVDGLHPYNVGKLAQGRPDFIPGTPGGVQQLLVRNGYDPAGRNVVICGRSDIVGKPLAILLMQRRRGRQRHCHRLSHPDQGPGGYYSPGRHSGGRRGQSLRHYRRHGQTGGGGDRRWHQPGGRRQPEKRIPVAG